MILRDLLVRTGRRASHSMEQFSNILRLRRSGARQLEIVSLEDRLMFSAAPAPAPAAPTPDAQMLVTAPLDGPQDSVSSDASQTPLYDSQAAAVAVLDQPAVDGASSTASRELVFIDTGAENYQQLLDDLWSHQDPNRHMDVVLLSSSEDGLTQITDTLAQYQTEKLDAVHLVTHGADRAIKLGNTWLDSGTLAANRDRIATWSQALNPGADLLIYGCDLAGNDLGRTLLSQMVQLTGADIAASIDDTGSTLLGGNWQLEYQWGDVETDVAFSGLLQSQWNSLLDAFTVTNTNDSGAGSLRQAILDANSLAGADTISFDIPDPLVGEAHTIDLQSALPEITDSVLIDGMTDSDAGAFGHPVIELNGTSAGNVNGLEIGATSTIRGLAINRFELNGIWLKSGSGGSSIEGNLIGTDVTGMLDRGNGSNGILIDSGSNTIGGSVSGMGNLISGNTGNGIQVQGLMASGNVIQGNQIGVTRSGDGSLGNGGDGIFLSQASDTRIGGTTSALRNVIAGNSNIQIEVSWGTGNVIQGNSIGVNSAATGTIAGGGVGITLNQTDHATVGGTAPGEGNVIGGAGNNAVWLIGNGSGTAIQGNWIGTDSTRTQSLANGRGVVLQAGASGYLIGGTADGAGNVISNSQFGAAILLETDAGTGNAVLGNSLTGNFGLGIDLAGDGVTANDASDADTGANDLANYPVIYSAQLSGGSITISGEAPAGALVEFFISPEASGNYGAGQTLIGRRTVTGTTAGTVDSSAIQFSYTFVAGSLIAGDRVTATATDTFNNTSEFAQNVAVIDTLAPVPIPSLGSTIAQDNSYSLSENSSAAGNVILDNTGAGQDSDAEGDILTVSDVNGSAANVGHSVILTSGASLTVQTDGTFLYAPGTAYDSLAAGQTAVDTFTYTVTDSNGNFSTATVTLTISGTNDAPQIVSSASLNSMLEDQVSPPGTLVSQLVDSEVTDVDSGALRGIAITGVDATNGSWEYTLDGTNWLSLGNPTASSARLLAADATTRVRFLPNLNWNGTITNAITYRAWDQTSGVNGGVANVAPSTVVDQFNVVSYANNNGTANWTGSWIETDNNGGNASGGLIRVTGGHLEVKSDRNNDNVYRQVDLSGATTARLSLSYQSSISSGNGDVVKLQASADGGGSYTTLAIFNATTNTGSGTLDLDISSFIASNTRVRFIVTSVDVTTPVWIDNLQIAYDVPTGGSSAFSSTTATGDITVQPVNVPPAIDVNTLSISEGGTVVLTPANIHASDSDNTPDQLTYAVSHLTGGQFELVTSPGIAVTSFSQQQVNNGELQFVHDGSDLVPYYELVVSDGTTTSAPLAVTIGLFSPVNDAPVIVAPANVTMYEFQTLYFSGADQIQIEDFDATVVEVTISVSNGGFNLSQTTGLTFTDGDGSMDSSVTFTGTLVDVNAALWNSYYYHGSGSGGAASLSISVSDLGGTGSGGPQTVAAVTNMSIIVPTAVVGDGFLQGQYLEIGLGQDGVLGSDGGAPSGFNNAGGSLAVQADRNRDGWATFDGDFIMPGTPEEAWGIQVGGTIYSNSNIEPTGISGGLINQQSTPAGQTIEWAGSQANLGVHQTYSVGTNDLYMDVVVHLTNLGTGDLTDVYYYRNVDADNNVYQGVSDGFTTTNTVVYQGDANGISLVTATQSDGSFLGLMGFGSNSRVSYGGFSNRDPVAIYTGGSGLSQSGTNYADEAISLAFHFQTIASGETVSAHFRYYFASTDATIPLVDLDTNDSSGHTGGDYQASFTEDGGAVSISDIDAGVLVSDHSNLTGMVISITNLRDGALESLSVDTTGTNVTASYDSGTGVLTLAGSANEADYSTVLRTLAYNNTSQNPDTTTRAITVTASTLSGASEVATSYVTVTATNDPPKITANSLTVSEGGTVVLSASNMGAVDPEASPSQLSWTVSGLTGGQFELIASPGVAITSFTQSQVQNGAVQFVHDGSETAPSYSVTVSDGSLFDGPQAASVTFNPVDDAPVLVTNTLSISEGAAVTITAGMIHATDVDNPASQLTYTVSSLAGGQFELVSSPGVAITSFTQSQINAAVVRFVHDGGEAAPSYSLTVSDGTLTDGPYSAIVTFSNVNDAPVITSNKLTISEGGAVVLNGGLLSTTDPDNTPSQLTYTVGTVSGGQFEFVATPGVSITSFTQAQVNSGLVQFVHDGGDVAPAYHLSVSDGLTNSASSNAVVTFSGVNDLPTISMIANQTVNEDAVLGPLAFMVGDAETAPGSLVVTASSSDTTLIPNASIVLGGVGANRSVTITPAANQYGGPVTITLSVSDGIATVQTAFTVTVQPVNDPPNLTPATFLLAENSPNGTVVGTAVASDVDVGDTLVFSIIGGDPAGAFTINPVNGQITVADGTQLDYETSPVWSLTIQVQDSRGATASGLLSIQLTDQNDHPPTIISDGGGATAAVSISENAMTVTTVVATDTDVSSILNYSITGADAGLFQIDPITGVLSFLTAPNFESPIDADANNVYQVTVMASDGVYTDTQALSVTVTNVNEFAVSPVSDTNPALNTVTENSGVGTLIGVTATANDPDAGDVVTYLLTNNAGGRVSIDSQSGVVSVAGAIDFEATPSLTFTVQATSSDGSFTSRAFVVTVVDTNDNPPVVVSNQILTVTENSLNGTSVGFLMASDVDTVGTLQSWTITGGTGAGAFAVNASTGEVTVANSSLLNFETNPTWTLLVTVSDGVHASPSQMVTINLTNANEAPSLQPATFHVLEQSAVGTVVGTVIGSDPDAGDTLTYTIIAGNSGGRFAIDPITGQITVANTTGFLHVTQPAYSIRVQVADPQGTAQIADYVVLIDPLNVPPVAIDDQYTTAQFTTLNTKATSGVVANDLDADGNSLSAMLVQAPQHGTVTLQADGSFVYVPDAYYYGTDAFTYQVTDGIDVSGVATVTLDVALLAPSGAMSQTSSSDNSIQHNSADTQVDTAGNSHAGHGNGTVALVIPAMTGVSAGGSQFRTAPLAQIDSVTPLDLSGESNSIDQVLASLSDLDPTKRLTGGPRRTHPSYRDRADYAVTATIRTLLPEPIQDLASAILDNRAMWDQLNTFRDQMREQEQANASLENLVVGTSTVVTGGLTVGYVAWLVRGGSLLATMVSVMPSWTSFDPLPVMERFEDGRRVEDNESLASIVTGAGKIHA